MILREREGGAWGEEMRLGFESEWLSTYTFHRSLCEETDFFITQENVRLYLTGVIIIITIPEWVRTKMN